MSLLLHYFDFQMFQILWQAEPSWMVYHHNSIFEMITLHLFAKENENVKLVGLLTNELIYYSQINTESMKCIATWLFVVILTSLVMILRVISRF
jgi:hypothetical protein